MSTLTRILIRILSVIILPIGMYFCFKFMEQGRSDSEIVNLQTGLFTSIISITLGVIAGMLIEKILQSSKDEKKEEDTELEE